MKVLVSTNAEPLISEMARSWRAAPLPLFEPEVVWVPTHGVERWLSQSLAKALDGRGSGICADVEFVRPGTFLRAQVDALGTAFSGHELEPLARALLVLLNDPTLSSLAPSLASYLGGEAGSRGNRRRVEYSRRLAALGLGLVDQRPELVRSWLRGERGNDQWPADLEWQRDLLLKAWSGLEPMSGFDQVCAQVASGEFPPGTPSRLWYFAPSRLSNREQEYLEALSAHRDVTLGLVVPSVDRFRRGLTGTDFDATDHPVLRSTNQELDEFAAQIGRSGWEVDYLSPPVTARPVSSQLRLFQDAVSGTSSLGQALPPDGSLQVHRCAGPLREVEVLRDVLCAAFDEIPGLEPKDIIVMSPAVSRYANSLLAAFPGAAGRDQSVRHPADQISIRIADRSLTDSNPVAQALAGLLDLANSRQGVAEVLGWLSLPPVRRALRLRDSDLAVLNSWIEQAEISWGLDASARSTWLAEAPLQGTWRWGMDRLLLGIALDPGAGVVAGLSPVAGVDSAKIDLLGRVAQAIDHLTAWVVFAQEPHSLGEWVTRLSEEVNRHCQVRWADGWQLTQVLSLLSDLEVGASADRLDLSSVAGLLAHQLRGRPTRSGFATGHVTVCNLEPMRTVPHRVVVLLGLDGDTFPRRPQRDGDDGLVRTRRPGEPDVRAEDLQQFLSACLSASDRLVLIYSGVDPFSGQSIAPSAAVSALVESEKVQVREHTLQPFDVREFHAPGGSFDATAAITVPPGLARTAPVVGQDPQRHDVIDIAELVRFWSSPPAWYVKHRLGVSEPKVAEHRPPLLPVELVSLDNWRVGEALIRDFLAGSQPEEIATELQGRGWLPPGALGEASFEQVMAEISPVLGELRSWRGEEPSTLAIDVELAGSRVLGSRLVFAGDCGLSASFSRTMPKHRIAHYIEWVAWQASQPEPARSVMVGRLTQKPWASSGPVPPDVSAVQLGGISQERARGLLTMLVKGYQAGQHVPLPFFPDTSLRVHQHAAQGGPTLWWERAGTAWNEIRYGRPAGDGTSFAAQLLWPGAGVLDFAQLSQPDLADLVAAVLQAWPDLAVQGRGPEQWLALGPATALALLMGEPLNQLEVTR